MLTRWVVALLLGCALPAAAQRGPVPLNDYTRLGQRFSCPRPVAGVAVTMPSWSDNEGGLTLRLWDSPERRTQLAERVLVGVVDNELVEIRPPKPLPAGSYYWEIADRTGTTRIGLYSDALPIASDDCAYFDGTPDRRLRFVFQINGAPPPRQPVTELIRAVESGAPEEYDAACRELAVHGTAAAVPALAGRLADRATSHLARYALESLPDPAADAALREALGATTGVVRVGIITTLGTRRDAGSVAALSALLADADQASADAAAVALGWIGTPAAAAALTAAMSSAARPAVFEGAVECATRLLANGRAEPAALLFDRLGALPAPRPIELAAARGSVVARGQAGVMQLRRLLREPDADRRAVALRIVAQELPGAAITQAVCADLPRLPTATRIALIEALAGRRDDAALPTLRREAAAGEATVRLAAIRALPRFQDDAALAGLLDDPAPEIREAAEAALAELPRAAASRCAGRLLADDDPARRRAGATLIQRLQLAGFGGALAAALTSDSPEVRLAVTRALAELGGSAELPALRDALLRAGDDAEAEACESAMGAVVERAADRAPLVAVLIAGADAAPTPRRAAIFRVLAAIGGATALEPVRLAFAGPAGDLQVAAAQVLCDWPDAAPAEPLLAAIAAGAPPLDRAVATQAVLRMGLDAGLDDAGRERLVTGIAGLATSADDRRKLLAILGRCASIGALTNAAAALPSDDVKDEACLAVVSIAERLAGGDDHDKLVGPLEQVLQRTENAEVLARAKALLDRLRADR